ncbi:MAG: mandelate racemase/muconate lactonizing enzyme family protein [Actinobacteria bacterium]|nr:mandelate racemase/muconate lactonizing enzyme family protein [Actinomycetota bacterium]
MRITGLSTAVIEANFEWTLVRVDTDEGVSGLGEMFFAPGLTGMLREFGTILEGEDPRDIDRLYQKMRWAASAGSIGGFAYNAISGIEAALWDLKGRALGVPVWQLLGGRFRNRVKIYADCHAGETLEALGPLLQRTAPTWAGESPSPRGGYFEILPEASEEYSAAAYAEKARAVADRGFTALKFDLDVPTLGSTDPDPYARVLSPAQLDHLVELVTETCAAVGPHVEVAFDCHWRFTVKDAIRLAKSIEHIPIAWLEDPTPPENPTALAKVTHATTTPIGCGENWFQREGFREALSLGALDIALPDFQKCGGLGEGKRIAELADLHALPVSPHNIAGPIGTLASAHVAAAIPNFHSLEWHAQDVPFFDELIDGDDPLIVDGYITLPETPGIGAELDLEVAARYAKPGERFFE